MFLIKKEQENLLAEWSEKASAYRWLHSRSEKRYRCRNYSFTINKDGHYDIILDLISYGDLIESLKVNNLNKN